MKATDEAARKDMLKEMGVSDGAIDLDTYTKSLQQKLSDVMSINKELRRYISDLDTDNGDGDSEGNKDDLTGNIMSGIDF